MNASLDVRIHVGNDGNLYQLQDQPGPSGYRRIAIVRLPIAEARQIWRESLAPERIFRELPMLSPAVWFCDYLSDVDWVVKRVMDRAIAIWGSYVSKHELTPIVDRKHFERVLLES